MDGVLLKPVEGSTEAGDDTRLTLRLSPTAKAELDWNANQLDATMTETIRRAVGLQRLMLEIRQRKGRILVEEPGQPIKEVVIV